MSLQVCVLGGTGFIGKEIVARLGAAGHDVKVLTRDPARHRDLQVLPSVRLVAADVHDEQRLKDEFQGCDVVINLVGILNETGLGRGNGEQFRRVHTELPQKCVRACRAAGVQRYLHMSGLQADSQRGPSHYLLSKGRAEDYVREHCAAGSPEYVIFQPSVVFGPGDAFINNFAGILKITPGLLPLACAEAKFAPVYVGDVADAFVLCLERKDVAGRTFQLCGPGRDDARRHRAPDRSLSRTQAHGDSAAARRLAGAGGRDGLRAGQAVLDRQFPVRHARLHLRLRRARRNSGSSGRRCAACCRATCSGVERQRPANQWRVTGRLLADYLRTTREPLSVPGTARHSWAWRSFTLSPRVDSTSS